MLRTGCMRSVKVQDYFHVTSPQRAILKKTHRVVGADDVPCQVQSAVREEEDAAGQEEQRKGDGPLGRSLGLLGKVLVLVRLRHTGMPLKDGLRIETEFWRKKGGTYGKHTRYHLLAKNFSFDCH